MALSKKYTKKNIKRTRNIKRNIKRTRNRKGGGPQSIFSKLIDMFKKCLAINDVDEFNQNLLAIQQKFEELTEQKRIFIKDHSEINDKLEELIDNKENNVDAMSEIASAEDQLRIKKYELKKILDEIKMLSRSNRSKSSSTPKPSIDKNRTRTAVRAITMR